jgi:hypothetical protein
MNRVLDLAIPDLRKKSSSYLYYGAPEEKPSIRLGSEAFTKYKEAGKVLRWYFGLMGETSPTLSPLSVDVAGDKNYLVYRYDWVFGISIPNVAVPDRNQDPDDEQKGQLWWDWQAYLTTGTCMAVQVIISPDDPQLAYTCVSTNLNVLPPSKNDKSWWQKNRKGIVGFVQSGTKIAQEWHPGMITKTFSALSNSLDAQDPGDERHWFIYQFVDSDSHSCAVEWRIYKNVLTQYGPLLRGSIVLAFHGGHDKGEQKGIRLVLRPQLGFIQEDDLKRITPTENLEDSDQVHLVILPVETAP